MTPIFDRQESWDAFKAVAESWLGTPYRHLQAAKRYGADCTLFVGSCLVEAGYMTELSYDYYPRDWHIHSDREFVLESALRHFREHMAAGYSVQQFSPGEIDLSRGDMPAFKTVGSRVTNHAGILWDDGRLLNAINRRGVCFMELTPPWIRRMTTVFRFCREV